MATQFTNPAAYEVLRTKIDAIKGPLKVHGMCIYLQRLGVVKPSREKNKGFRLGAGEKRFAADNNRSLPKLGVKRPLSDLYGVQHVTVYAEYVSAALCMEKGRFKENRSARSKARISGRCSKCREKNHRSAYYCRHQMKHTTPASLEP